MGNFETINDNTPILIGAGQVVQREANSTSPMELAAMATLEAIEDSGSADIAGHIDTICGTSSTICGRSFIPNLRGMASAHLLESFSH